MTVRAKAWTSEAAAYRIRAELVCCRIYEQINDTHEIPLGQIPPLHAICYWGEAAARIAEGRCPGYETEPNICRCNCHGCQTNAFPGPFQVWPLARVLREVAVGSGDWTWDEEWADLDQRHAATGYLDTLEQKIRENGITMPVLIGSDGRLWDGHHRLRIAVRLGIGYVPVEIVPRTTEGMGNASYPTEGEK